ncbi:unnamed protein product [Eruca vesicaria subsp. sativa]|uniref:WRKY domain-containing protein n=1 Tax=Eruca vesicaria subsp. sativa TaxID=29727 RepID=A0ABC8L948_ERUVS|nr:unnamed protein product [Eruca vesicaria subsp. sativa]
MSVTLVEHKTLNTHLKGKFVIQKEHNKSLNTFKCDIAIKQVKGSDFPRSYYKCTHQACPVKKKVEGSVDGQVTKIIYKGQHSHEPPQNNKRGGGNNNGSCNSVNKSQRDQETSQVTTTEQMSEASDSEEVGNADTSLGGTHEDEPDPKRRNTEVRVSESVSLSNRTATEPRIIVQTKTEVDLLDDGYRWRTYGQKVVKGNPYPSSLLSYYKCITPGCRKHVVREEKEQHMKGNITMTFQLVEPAAIS